MIWRDGWWIPTATDEVPHPVQRRARKAIVIERALQHHTMRRVAIQAGAHLGLWPLRLSRHYQQVLAFEPVAENFECARENVKAAGNVLVRQAALGALEDEVDMLYTRQSTGTHYVLPDGGGARSVSMITIDGLHALSVDAIFLDVEGYELAALVGGHDTIKRDRPLIVVEENHCGERYAVKPGDIGRYLKPLGYREVTRYSHDIVFAC